MRFFTKSIKDYEFPSSLPIAGKTYTIKVEFLAKKNASVSLGKDRSLLFRLSKYTSKKQKLEHFEELLKKISKKILKTGHHLGKTFEEILEEAQFRFNQENYYLEYTTKLRGVKLQNNTFYINVKTKPHNIEKHIINLLLQRYGPRLEEYIKQLNQKTYKYPIKDVEVKVLESKWGHCTKDNVIMINIKLLNAPTKVLDYVIIHELSHVYYKHHQNSFWKEVERFCPDHKKVRKYLKNNPPQLFS